MIETQLALVNPGVRGNREERRGGGGWEAEEERGEGKEYNSSSSKEQLTPSTLSGWGTRGLVLLVWLDMARTFIDWLLI